MTTGRAASPKPPPSATSPTAPSARAPYQETARILDVIAQTSRNRNIRPAGDPARALRLLEHRKPRSGMRPRGCWVRSELNQPAKRWWPGSATRSSIRRPIRPRSMDCSHSAAGNSSDSDDADRKVRRPAAATRPGDPGTRRCRSQEAATRAAQFFSALGDSAAAPAAATPVFDAFVTRKDGPAALAAAIEGTKVPEKLATLGLQKAASAGAHTRPLQECSRARRASSRWPRRSRRRN